MWIRWLVKQVELERADGLTHTRQTKELQVFVDGRWTKVPEVEESDFKVDTRSGM